jgi:DNA-3-methyladenine glycosylase
MNKKILTSEFFNRPVATVAQDLIGKFLVRKVDNKKISLMLTEVEAYDGSHDLASHARFGKTKRNEPMFGPAGHFYIYLIYGMYNMLNIVTGAKDYPAAVLIRGTKEITGPGRLTKQLKIDKTLNNQLSLPESGLWIEDRGVKILKKKVIKTPRIGVEYARPVWNKKLYRFILNL